LSSREFFDEAEREQLAKSVAQKYGLVDQGVPTVPQVAAVSFFSCKLLNIGESTSV